MKPKLKKGLKRRLRRLAEKYGATEAAGMVAAYFGGLGGSSPAAEEDAPEAEQAPVPVAAAEPTPIYPPYPPPEPGQPQHH